MTLGWGRSRNTSLDEGATDGKYRKVRPDTEVIPGLGNEPTEDNRNSLNPFMNYGYITSQASHMHNPGR